MELRRAWVWSAGALLLAAGCGESFEPMDEDAAIVFDASFPDAGTDAGPPPSNVGAVCETDADCVGVADFCYGALGGYCTVLCTSDADCPESSTCLPLDGRTNVCLASCGEDPADACADGLGCTGGPGTGIPPICLPGCEGDAECGEGLTCVIGGGDFGAGLCIDPEAPLGGACTSDGDCPTNAICATGGSYPGGTCVLTGACNPNIDAGCPDDARCLPGGFGGGICFDGCTADSDCRSGWECDDSTSVPGRDICEPVFDPARLGAACESAGCPGGTCIDERFNGWPASYCAEEGCDTADPTSCPTGGICAPTAGGGLCLDACTADTECRTGYRCRPVDFDAPSAGSACFPGCTADSQCTATTGGGTPYVCNPGTGRCARPFDPAELGDACVGDFRECRGGSCLTEDSSGWPGGICVYPGCRLSGEGPSATCPEGSVCTDDGTGDPELGICVDACTVGSTSCRAGYACVAVAEGSTEGACRPACTAASCDPGNTCNTASGLCE